MAQFLWPIFMGENGKLYFIAFFTQLMPELTQRAAHIGATMLNTHVPRITLLYVVYPKWG